MKRSSENLRGARVHGHVEGERPSAWQRVWDVVRTVPFGMVTTYGDVSRALGSTLSPVAVGWALHGCPDDVPWHRVVNASGRCSTERLPDLPRGAQRRLLEDEGVEFDTSDTIDFGRFRANLGRPEAELFDGP